MDGPVTALPGAIGTSGDFDEAVVEAEIMAEGILPSLSVGSVEREFLHDKLVNLCQREHLLIGVLDGHVGEPDVRIWGFLEFLKSQKFIISKFNTHTCSS